MKVMIVLVLCMLAATAIVQAEEKKADEMKDGMPPVADHYMEAMARVMGCCPSPRCPYPPCYFPAPCCRGRR